MTSYDPRQLSMIVSHAAHHLHAVVGSVATALLDTSTTPRMLFSNSVLSQVGGSTLIELARYYAEQGCEELPCIHCQAEGNQTLFFVVLDEKHVFVVIGKAEDEVRVQEFVERLKGVLPAATG